MSFLADLVDDLFDGVFTDLGFTESSTYVVITGSYNTATSETTNTETTSATVTAVYYSKKDSLAVQAKLAPRGGVDTTNTLDVIESNLPKLTAVIPAKQLSDASITPKVNDILRRGSTDYTIESVQGDPASAEYRFGLRAP